MVSEEKTEMLRSLAVAPAFAVFAIIERNETVADLIQAGKWFDVFTSAYVGLMGETAFSLFTVFTLVTISWIYSGSITIPTILILYTAAAVSMYLPALGNLSLYVFLGFAVATSVWRVLNTQRRG